MIVSLALALIFVHTERGSCSVGVSNTTMLDDDGCQRCWMLADDAAAASDDADDSDDDDDDADGDAHADAPSNVPLLLI